MPEGPEIKRAAVALATALDGQLLEQAWFGLPALSRYAAELAGARILNVVSRGKALLIRFDRNLSLYTHNQLYGVWFLRQRDKLPTTKRSLRLALHTKRHSALLYSASEIELLTPEQELNHPYLSRLGPDVLVPVLTWRDISRRLNESTFRNRALGSLYLDQAFLAGIGNYLRSEILFAARLHPAWKPSALSLKNRNLLARQTLTISRRSYDTGGITNSPARVAQAKAQRLSREQYRFAVFDRTGSPCPVCTTLIERSEMGSRRIYCCPTCQPYPGEQPVAG